MDADRNSYAVLAFAVGIDKAHFACADGDLLTLDTGHELYRASFCWSSLLVAIILETPGECRSVIGDVSHVILRKVSKLSVVIGSMMLLTAETLCSLNLVMLPKYWKWDLRETCESVARGERYHSATPLTINCSWLGRVRQSLGDMYLLWHARY
jgi:hypothetical protein